MSNYSLKNRILQLLQSAMVIPLQVIGRYRSDRLARHAGALSFSTLLALAPMVAIVFSMMSLFTPFEQMGAQLEEFIYQVLVPAAGDELRAYLDQFAAQVGKLTLVGLALFLLTALILLFNIEESFNDIWRVERGRSLSSRISIYWAMLSLGPLLMGASLAMSTYILSQNFLLQGELVGQLQSVGFGILPFLFELLAFLLLYLVMPNVKVSVRHAFFGALLASLLFELSKKMFALYILNYANYELVYGALSTLPIFLIWVYLSWVVTLIGAELVAVLQMRSLTGET